MSTPIVEPRLTDRTPQPKGVLQKNLKILLYIGVAMLLVVAMVFSAKKKTTRKPSDVAPRVEAQTESNAAQLHAQLAADQPPAPVAPIAITQGTPAQQVAAQGYQPNGMPAPYVQPQQVAQASQISPQEQEAQQLAMKERERLDESRFASNLVMASQSQEDRPTNLQPARSPGDPRHEEPVAEDKRKPEVNVDSALGQPYVIYEGTTLDTILMNRLDGDAVGPVKVLVSSPLYSHDHQHVLIPDGTQILGEAKKIGANGFGQQRRMAIVFHRLIMPDGYSIDLDQFQGLDQIGQSGLKDTVNNHYLEIFGTSIALGVISGAAQITEGGSLFGSGGMQEFTTGASSGVSQQAATILDKFIQIPPTITIREGHRVKVYISQDLLVPAYTNHTIQQTF